MTLAPDRPSASTGADPAAAFEYVEGWGMSCGAHSRVLRPTTVEEIRAAYQVARRDGTSIGLRGSGCSYGDASVNDGGHVLDVSRMDRILDWDPETGVAELEAGVTIEQLWKHILKDGWWPRVVSGTMCPTVAGAAAMNIHGKNNFSVGTFGEAVHEVDLVLPSGEVRTCSPSQNADLYFASIGGFGMLGTFSRVRLQTKRVYSGEVEVRAFANRNLREMMDYMEAHRATSDYLVGWIDGFSPACRGLVHDARYLQPGEDLEPERTLAIEHQTLPSRFFGVIPKREMWRFLRLLINDVGWRAVCSAKYVAGRMEAMGEPHRQPHAVFNFLLDFIPRWKWGYGPGGLIQYQSFLPAGTAHDVYIAMQRWNARKGIYPYLGVFKRHRPDPFWLTHAVDGWSLAMDFRVTERGRADLWKHCAELTEIVLEGGGKFYFAKDLVIGHADMVRYFPPDRLEAFLDLKRSLDPEGLLQTNLWRRIFTPPGG